MQLVGNILTIGLYNIVEFISNNQKSGVLVVKSEDETAKFFFRSGILAHGAVLGMEPQLGNILLYRGIVSEEELERIAQEHKTTGKPLGQISQDFGIASKEEIRYCMQLEAEEQLFEVLAWQKGSYSFAEKNKVVLNRVPSKPSEELLVQGKLRLHSILELRSMFPHRMFELKLKDDASESMININLTALELKILSLLSQPMLLDDVCAQSPANSLGTIRVLKDLLNCGLITITSMRSMKKDFKHDDISTFDSLCKFYFKLNSFIFNYFRNSYDKGAFKTLMEAFMKTKRKYRKIFNQIVLEAEGQINDNTIMGNLVKLDSRDREHFFKRAMNYYLLTQMVMIKNYLGLKVFEDFIHQCRNFQSEMDVSELGIHGVDEDFESVVLLAQATPSYFEQGLNAMMEGDFRKAEKYLRSVVSTSSDYNEAQTLLVDLETQYREVQEGDILQIGDLNLIPVINQNLDEKRIQELPLLPNEIYLFTRIDGITNIKGLLNISHMPKNETLQTIARFIQAKYITLLTPEQVQERVQSEAETFKMNKVVLPEREKVPVGVESVQVKPTKVDPKFQKESFKTMDKNPLKNKNDVKMTIEREPVKINHRSRETVSKKTSERKPIEKSRKDIAREHYNKAMKYFNSQDYANAIKEFEHAIENNPMNIVYYNMLDEAKLFVRRFRGSSIYNNGVNALNSGKLDQAISYFKEALKIDQNDIRTLNKLVEVLAARPKTLKTAGKLIRKAIELDFSNSKNYVLLGKVLIQNGKIQEARQAFETALEWDNNCREAIQELRLLKT